MISRLADDRARQVARSAPMAVRAIGWLLIATASAAAADGLRRLAHAADRRAINAEGDMEAALGGDGE